MERSLPARGRLFVLLGLLGAASFAACSGGGASSTPASPGPPLGGLGSTVSFDQRVNFTVLVPPETTLSAIAAARRKHLAIAAAQRRYPATTPSTNPYVSPKTGSVALQVVTVDGVSPQTLPAPDIVNITCASSGGCSVPIQNVPAAKGVNRFTVQTFSGAGGSGNLISSGFIDVTAPSAQATSFGGTALTIGGFVQSILLTLNAPSGGFTWHKPATGTVDVNALDPAGAIIIGSVQLANAIDVSLPSTDESAFTLDGAPQVSLQQPAQSLTLAYDGIVLFGGTIAASTTDENSQPVATSIPIALKAPPTPVPTPVSVSKPPLSLYVFDASADRIIEYGGVNDVESGHPFNTTPRRIFEVAAPAGSPALCPAVDGVTPALASMAIGTNATLYAQTYCTDVNSVLAYTFMYAGSTQEAIPATGTPTPPTPTSTFAVTAFPANNALGNFAEGIKLDEARNVAYLQYEDSVFAGGEIFGVQLSKPSNVTTEFGQTCLQQFGAGGSCASNGSFGYGNGSAPFTFAIDANSFLYLPSTYSGIDGNGNVFIPPGDPAQQFSGEPAVLVFPANTSNPVASPLSALAGFKDDLGFSGAVDAIEGTNLYVFANGPGPITVPGNSGDMVYPGLSGCPAPSASAVPDVLTTVLCVDGNAHNYIAGFANATSTLTAAGNAGTNVAAAPTFMLGGDQVGGFGDGISTPGDLIAVRDGFAFVLNDLPPSGGPAEIDVYNTNGLSGFHTDTPPITRLVLAAPIVPTTIAIGATGTGVGGAALLRRPARAHHDIRAWGRLLQQRRTALRAQLRPINHP